MKPRAVDNSHEACARRGDVVALVAQALVAAGTHMRVLEHVAAAEYAARIRGPR